MNQSNIFEDNRFTLNTWLIQLFVQFMMNELQYKKKTVKLLYILSFLKESALKWMQLRFDDYVTNFSSNRQEEI